MSVYNALREDKGRNRQYDTMELEGDRQFKDDKKMYTRRQMACVVCIVIIIFIFVFLLIWFLAPLYHCTVPYSPPPSVDVFPWQSEKLPEFAYPIHYSLSIDADPTEFQFRGDVNITFKILENTDSIVLNAGNLNFTRFTLFTKGNLERYQHSISRQQLYLKFDRILKSGLYTIGITYSGHLQRNMEGIYVTSYLHPQGMERQIVATHFANKHARQGFPCFDEPRFKSTFELSLTHTFDYDPISNTAVKETTPNGKRVTSVFEQSPNTSTQSLAFLVSDFKYQKRDYHGVSVRVFTPGQFYAEGSFATETCINVLKYYNSIGFPLSFQKLDISCVPNSGYSGTSALNIIFMKPSNILWDQEGSTEDKHVIISSIAHQIGYQYFGNQVSMNFWEDTWFMEGISTYFEHLAKGQILNKETTNFQVDIIRSALRLGSLSHCMPLNVNVPRQSETNDAFDKVAYYKGAALVWMLDNYVGSNIIQNSLLNVLEEYKDGSVSFSDIWRVIDQKINSSSPINVSTLMKSWIENEGYPLVTILHRGDHLFISQEPFFSNENETRIDVIWDIPVTVKTDSALEYYVLRQRNDSLNISKEATWFKANFEQTGFYRVNYDEPTWKSLSGMLQHSPQSLSSFDRSGLIDDALTLARQGKLDIEIAFGLLEYLEKEKDYKPWKAALYHFHEITMVMQDNDALLLLQDYIRSVLSPLLKAVDWSKDESLVEANIPTAVLATALENNDLDVTKYARRLFHEWMSNSHSIPPNLREIVFWAGVKYGENEEWEFCWNKYQNADDPREKTILLLALGKSRYAWFQRRYLRLSLNESVVSIEDVPLMISSVAENVLGGFFAWEFIQEYWPYLREMFEKDSIFLKSILTKATAYFSTEFMYHQVKSFFEETEQDKQLTKQCLETIRSNMRWKNRTEMKFVHWLNQRRMEATRSIYESTNKKY